MAKQLTKKDLEEQNKKLISDIEECLKEVDMLNRALENTKEAVESEKNYTQSVLNHIGDLLLIDSGKTFKVTPSPYGPIASPRQSTLASITYNIGELHTYRREYCELKDRLLPAAPQVITTSVNKIEGLKGSDN